MSKKYQKGFTIIEVLIVLAIAGLIMLVVFLAVPALQRNSRNTQYKNGASSVLSTANEFITNNNGTMPTTMTITNGTINVSSTVTGTTPAEGKTQGGYSASSALSTGPTANTPGEFALYVNRKCDGNALASGTTNRALAVLYYVETRTTTVLQCTES